MKVWRRSDGTVALDWGPPGGPFIVVTAEQFKRLVQEIKRQGGLL